MKKFLSLFFKKMWTIPGTLILIPVILILFAPHWTINRSYEADDIRLINPQRRLKISLSDEREVRSWFYSEGTVWTRGTALSRGEYLYIRLKRPIQDFRLLLQANSNDSYLVEASYNKRIFFPVWTVEPKEGEGLRTRDSHYIENTQAIKAFRIIPLNEDAVSSFSGFIAEKHPKIIPSRLYILFAGLFFSLVFFLPEKGFFKTIRGSLFSLWQRSDVFLTALMLYFIFFEIEIIIIVYILIMLILILFSKLFRYMAVYQRPYLISLGITILAVIIIIPPFFDRYISYRLSHMHDLTVDHRLRPDGKEINQDRIRYKGNAETFRKADFGIMFMGDSFVYGYALDYYDSLPYIFERLANERKCSKGIKAVNTGWTSSSPLLGYRLLRDIGPDYKPDLIVYFLDMTDFHDDLRYEDALRHLGHFSIDSTRIITHLLRRFFPGLYRFHESDIMPGELRILTSGHQKDALDYKVPGEYFFITKAPLEETRELIERGVMKNLLEMYHYARNTLKSEMVVVIFPRAYQYSGRESPNNWERAKYEVLGPYAQEPFEYFEEVRDSLPFKIINLLPDFQDTDRFPLFFDDDPHWNVVGARFVAERFLDYAEELSLIPCE